MAIISVTTISAGRTAEYDDEFRQTYEKVFRVVTDSALDEQATVLAANGIPLRHSIYYDLNGVVNRFALCEKVSARVEDEEYPLQWLVTASYSTKRWDEIRRKGGPDQQNQNQQPENPLNDPPDVSYDFQAYQDVIDKDLGTPSLPVTNSAGERFNPAKEAPMPLIVLTIVKNEANYSPATAINYYGAVNSDEFFGFSIGTVMCMGIKGQSEYKNDYFFFKVTYVFHVRPHVLSVENQIGTVVEIKGWAIDEAPLDHGRRQLVAGKLVDITKNGVPVDDYLLDGAGVASTTGRPIYLTNPINGGNQKFVFYTRRNFAALGI